MFFYFFVPSLFFTTVLLVLRLFSSYTQSLQVYMLRWTESINRYKKCMLDMMIDMTTFYSLIPDLTTLTIMSRGGNQDYLSQDNLSPLTFHLGFVHPLQDVALHQCLPLSSVCCFPVSGGSLLPCYVVLPSSAWSSSWPLPSPWLPLCAAFGPPTVLQSCMLYVCTCTLSSSSSSAFPSYNISGAHHFWWDFCICDRFSFLIQPLR